MIKYIPPSPAAFPFCDPRHSRWHPGSLTALKVGEGNEFSPNWVSSCSFLLSLKTPKEPLSPSHVYVANDSLSFSPRTCITNDDGPFWVLLSPQNLLYRHVLPERINLQVHFFIRLSLRAPLPLTRPYLFWPVLTPDLAPRSLVALFFI